MHKHRHGNGLVKYTSHTVDSSALVKETDTLPTRQMLGGALSKHPRTTRE
jgi:hypothetical protein